MSKIPGFRSGKTWKKVIAIVGYLFIALILWAGISGDNGSTPTASPPANSAAPSPEPDKTSEQIAQEKAEANKITASDKELLKKSYSTFDAQQQAQFAAIKEKYNNLPNAEVTDISADFARLSTEEAAEIKKQAEAKAAEEAKAAYQAWVKDQFSAWDGSNRYLVNLVKEHLNDPKSFEHVDTSYADMGDHLIIKMKYRAKNGFGGLVLQNVTGKADYKTQMISVISQND
jgi:hypothetical protein